MKVGDLCKVISSVTHVTSQEGDLVMITKDQSNSKWEESLYIEGINLKTLAFHHYTTSELEIVSESR